MTKGFLTSGVAMACVMMATPCWAQARGFSVPAQAATKSIPEFARQAGIQIVAPGGRLRGLRTRQVRGQFDVRAALKLLISDTGLRIVADDGATITLAFATPDPVSSPVTSPASSPIEPQASQVPATDEASPEILVTGSRIRRAGFDTLQPANSVPGDKIAALSYNTAADVINDLPAFGTPTSNRGGQNGQTVGQSFVNAFSLGTARTLTLLNGRRVVSQASPGNSVDPGLQVDLNIIPAIMVDRIEAIYTGGAPIYGTDAIAGTVNVILKDRYQGLLVDAQHGISERGDAYNLRLGALLGTSFADDRGHLLVGGEYNRIDGVSGIARKRPAINYSYCNNPANTGPNDGIPNQIICEGADSLSLVPLTGAPTIAAGGFYGTNRTANAFVSGGQPLLFSLDGQSLITAAAANLGTPLSATASSGADAPNNPYVVNQAETNSLVSPLTRKVVSAQADYAITDGITAYFEGLYAQSKSVDEYSQGAFTASLFSATGGQLLVRLDNPFVTPAVANTIRTQLLARDVNRDGVADNNPNNLDLNRDGVADTPGFFLARYNQDLLTDAPTYRTQDVFRVVAGLKGDFAAIGTEWHWDASYNYGRTKAVVSAPAINFARFALAADAVQSGGQIVCRATVTPPAAAGTATLTTPIQSSDITGCVPFNPLGYATSPNMTALRNYLIRNTVNETRLEQQIAEATLSGTPFRLPAGGVSVATGVTYRREQASYGGGDAINQGFYLGSTIPLVQGRFETKEAYAETVIPILSKADGFTLPLVSQLTFEGAARYVDNSITGNDWTWTAGGRLKLDLPLLGDAITIRGNITHAVRAPSFAELFTPTTATQALGNDPCDPRYITVGAAAANRAASCAAQVAALKAAGSLPANFQLSGFTSDIVNVSGFGTTAGDASLDNERSKSWTIGMLIAPTTLPGLRISVDWTDIRITNSIVSANLTQLFASCYDNGAFGSDNACSRFTRSPTTFQVTSFELGFLNAAERHFAGLLADVQYRFPLTGLGVPGTFTVGATGLYTKTNEQRIARNDLDIFAAERGNEQYKVQGNFQYATGSFSALWQVNYVSNGVIDRQATAEARSPGTFDAFWQHDLGLSATVNDRLTLRATVTNVFDATDSVLRVAAKQANAVIGGANLFENVIGRSYSVGARIRF